MTLAAIPSFLAILFCASLFVLLYQYLLPRPAPWRLVAVALGAGMACTLALVGIMTYLITGAHEQFLEIDSLLGALPIAIFRAGLPEEFVKALAAFLAILMFRRHISPAAAFQVPLFVAVGFAVVENNGYSDAFPEFRMLIAFGRGFMATFIHSLLAVIQGVILMRMVMPRVGTAEGSLEPDAAAAATPSGALDWSKWYIPLLGMLVAAACHAFYDWGLLPLTAEFLRTGTVQEATAGLPLAVGACGIATLFVAGLWCLKIGTRRAAMWDPIVNEPRHIARVATWRKAGMWVMLLAAVVFIGGIGCFVMAGISGFKAGAEAAASPQVQQLALIGALGVAGAIFLTIIGWVVRQKR